MILEVGGERWQDVGIAAETVCYAIRLPPFSAPWHLSSPREAKTTALPTIICLKLLIYLLELLIVLRHLCLFGCFAYFLFICKALCSSV